LELKLSFLPLETGKTDTCLTQKNRLSSNRQLWFRSSFFFPIWERVCIKFLLYPALKFWGRFILVLIFLSWTPFWKTLPICANHIDSNLKLFSNFCLTLINNLWKPSFPSQKWFLQNLLSQLLLVQRLKNQKSPHKEKGSLRAQLLAHSMGMNLHHKSGNVKPSNQFMKNKHPIKLLQRARDATLTTMKSITSDLMNYSEKRNFPSKSHLYFTLMKIYDIPKLELALKTIHDDKIFFNRLLTNITECHNYFRDSEQEEISIRLRNNLKNILKFNELDFTRITKIEKNSNDYLTSKNKNRLLNNY